MKSENTRLYVILITLTAVIVTALEILDGTIVSVALNSMRGSLGANISQMSWTMTGYITAAAIMMPLTGFLAERFGRKRLMLVAISGFGLASVLCGFSTNLPELVILRILQGAFGSLLGPLSQALLAENFRKEDLGKAMAFYGIGLVTAPILGPIIGGVVASSLGWRWDFFINIPVCVVALFAVWFLVKPSKNLKKMPVDWLGMFLLFVAIGGLEYILNRGTELGWLASNQIIIIGAIMLFAFIVFILRGIDLKEKNIVNLSCFTDRNYVISFVLMLMFAMAFIALNTWIPALLEQLQNYPILTAGLTMGPRGLSSMLSMFLTAMLIKRVPSRFLIAAGFIFFAIGAFIVSHYNPNVDQNFFFVANILQGLASGLFFVPVSKMAYITLADSQRENAAGLFNFSRTVGSSIGIALFSNIVAKEKQVNWHYLRATLNVSNPNFQNWLHIHHLTPQSKMLGVKLTQILTQQSQTIAYNDAFHLTMIMAIILVPFAFLLRSNK